jgi:hypothetical protein
MFLSDATASATIGPVAADWTIHDLVAWIADDDARSHDEALRPLLMSVLADLAPDASPALTPRSPVALVRLIASRLRAAPALREVTLREVALRGVKGGPFSVGATPATVAAGDRGSARPAAARPAAQVSVVPS